MSLKITYFSLPELHELKTELTQPWFEPVIQSHARTLNCFYPKAIHVMNTQGEKGIDSHAERSRCLFHLHRRQELWSQASNCHTQAGESKLIATQTLTPLYALYAHLF